MGWGGDPWVPQPAEVCAVSAVSECVAHRSSACQYLGPSVGLDEPPLSACTHPPNATAAVYVRYGMVWNMDDGDVPDGMRMLVMAAGRTNQTGERSLFPFHSPASFSLSLVVSEVVGCPDGDIDASSFWAVAFMTSETKLRDVVRQSAERSCPAVRSCVAAACAQLQADVLQVGDHTKLDTTQTGTLDLT